MFGGSYPGQAVPASLGFLAAAWGVDSVTHTDNVRPVYPPGKTFFDLVTDQATLGGRNPPAAPVFWGRYIGSPDDSFNLKLSEAAYLGSKNCRVLLIYNGENRGTVNEPDPVKARQNGVNAANNAIARARDLAVPEVAVPQVGKIWIYCNIEPAWSPTKDFFIGWLQTMQASGYGAGVYGSTSTAPGVVFSDPYCAAYTDPATAATPPKYLYTTYPPKGCWTFPTFVPGPASCKPKAENYQYSINCPVNGASFRPVSLRASGTLATANQQSSITPTAPSFVGPNDVLLTFVQFSTPTNTTITPPAGWVLVLRVDDGAVEGLAIYRAPANTAFGPYTFSRAQDITARAYAYKGVDPTTPIDTAAVGQANSPSPTVTAPSITTVTDNALIVGFFCALDGSGALTMNSVNAPLAQRTIDRFVFTAGEALVVGVGDQNTGPGPTGTRTATLSAPVGSIGILVALRPGDPEQVDLDLANTQGFEGMWLSKFPIFAVWRAGRVFVPGNIRNVFVASVSNDVGVTWSAPVNNPPGDNDYNFLGDVTGTTFTTAARGQSVDVYYVAGVQGGFTGQIRRVTFSGGVWSSPTTQYVQSPSAPFVRTPYAFRSANFIQNSLCWRETVARDSQAGNVMYADIDASTGNIVGTPVLLASNSIGISDPIGRYDSNGNPVVSWTENPSFGVIVGKKRTREVGVWQPPVTFTNYTDPNDFDWQRFQSPPSGRPFTAQLTSPLATSFRAIAKANLTDTDLTFVFRKKPENPVDISVNLRTVTEPPDPTLAVSMNSLSNYYDMALWEMGDLVLWTFFTTEGTGGAGPWDLWAVLGKTDGTDWHVKRIAQEGVTPNTGPDVWGIKPIDFGRKA
jgi:hypothetical protein